MANTKYVICASLIASAAAIAGCSKNEVQPQAADESAPAQVEVAPASEAAPEVAPASDVAPSPEADEAVLTIGEATLNRSDIDKAVAKIFAEEKVPEAQKEYAAQQIANQLAKSFIVSNVLGKKAKELGYSVTDEEVKAKEEEVIKGLAGRPNAPRSIEEAAEKSPMGKERALAEFRDGVLIDKMIKGEVIAKNTKDYTVEAQLLLARYNQAKEKGAADFEEAKKKIEAIKAEIDAVPETERAAKFAEIAKEKSNCPSSRNGGDLDVFTRGVMVKEFEDVAFAQNVGEISGPVKTQFGYHLIMTTDKIPAKEATENSPAEPEKCRASHILIKVDAPTEEPKLEDFINFVKQQDETNLINEFILRNIVEANIKASDDFKHLLPPPEMIEKFVVSRTKRKFWK